MAPASAPRPLDERAGTVVTFEKHHARPARDRVFVMSGEIVIEPEEQELFDSRLTVGVAGVRASTGWWTWESTSGMGKVEATDSAQTLHGHQNYGW